MKQIIPFKKDIILKTHVHEITSISLEHTLKVNLDNVISGEFIINGDYKMTEASVSKEDFAYNLPFDIAIDEKYDCLKSLVDVTDFYYEIINNEILRINIEISIDDIFEKENIKIDIEDINYKEEITALNRNAYKEEINIEEIIKESEKKPMTEKETSNTKINIFNDFDGNESFSTYKVYIVREEDTIESIIEKYNITRDSLLIYNDISNLSCGDKLIIPTK